jgi:hypothetical protein
MECHAGCVQLDKSNHQIAYCAQNPCKMNLSATCIWVLIHFMATAGLEHATIRDNIVFHSRQGFNEQRYNKVVEACALHKDFEILEAGDSTGERYPGTTHTYLITLYI